MRRRRPSCAPRQRPFLPFSGRARQEKKKALLCSNTAPVSALLGQVAPPKPKGRSKPPPPKPSHAVRQSAFAQRVPLAKAAPLPCVFRWLRQRLCPACSAGLDNAFLPCVPLSA